jgi:thermostable 8-oxoguanine DNA glycosylase
VIDPQNIVREYTDGELEELLVFCICVAGKTAKTIAPRVHKIIHEHELGIGPFIEYQLKTVGIGCYKAKAKSIREAVKIKDLRTCTVEDLESVYGIGPKTARAFLMWSRPDEEYAILDTHILKWLKSKGIENVPKSTPTGKKYLTLEKTFLQLVPEGMAPAEFDLEIWREYSGT